MDGFSPVHCFNSRFLVWLRCTSNACDHHSWLRKRRLCLLDVLWKENKCDSIACRILTAAGLCLEPACAWGVACEERGGGTGCLFWKIKSVGCLHPGLRQKQQQQPVFKPCFFVWFINQRTQHREVMSMCFVWKKGFEVLKSIFVTFGTFSLLDRFYIRLFLFKIVVVFRGGFGGFGLFSQYFKKKRKRRNPASIKPSPHPLGNWLFFFFFLVGGGGWM